MFCYQCEQTAGGKACVSAGVCGKDSETSDLQDLLVYAAQGISQYAHRASLLGAKERAVDVFVIEALFSTVTNVDFDANHLEAVIRKAAGVRSQAKKLYEEAAQRAGKTAEVLSGPASWEPAPNRGGLLVQAGEIGIEARRKQFGEVLAGLQDLLTGGLKGVAAYADHAQILGQEDDKVYAFFHEALNYLAETAPTADALLGLSLRTGEINLRAMELLDAANTGAYGHPVPTSVRVTPVKGKAILVSGHDLKDLYELLKQTEGKGINVYTHGEMLPAHGYPELKKFSHLKGNYGGAWQDQRKEFDEFPGAIVMTTNCIQKPKDSYRARIFTRGLVGWPGVRHISRQDYHEVIQAALAAPGFAQDGPDQHITVGFGHHAVLGVADKVVGAVKAGKIKHFYLIGGCDGAKSGRNYYTEMAQSVPKDSVILTLACGKYRFNKLDFGAIEGIPRLLDIGQCNDAYSAIKIASALANAFGTDVNGLPLSIILSWYEQKAVAVLLTLLHLGIKNMRLGPSLPAFVTPPVLQILVDKFGLAPITTPQEDLRVLAGVGA